MRGLGQEARLLLKIISTTKDLVHDLGHVMIVETLTQIEVTGIRTLTVNPMSIRHLQLISSDATPPGALSAGHPRGFIRSGVTASCRIADLAEVTSCLSSVLELFRRGSIYHLGSLDLYGEGSMVLIRWY